MSMPWMADALHQWFEKCGVPIGGAISREADLAALENRTGLRFPDDFRQYLLELSPSEENYDDEDTNWWPIARMRTIAEEYGHEIYHAEIAAARGSHLFFADYSIWSWAWTISCTDDHNHGRIARIGGSPTSDCFVAENFDAFVEIYLRDPLLL